MAELFLIGTFWFWVLLAGVVLLLFVCVDQEQGFWATVVTLVFLGCLQWMGQVPIYQTVLANPWLVVFWALLYVLIGMLWGVAKWYLFCVDKREQRRAEKANWLPYGQYTDWAAYVKDHPRLNRPLPSDHKADIIRWMSWWPISMLWSLLDDFVKRVFRAIYNEIAALLERISEHVFQGEDL